MTKLRIALTAVALAALMVPTSGQAKVGEPGCFVYGDGPTLNTERICAYTAVDAEQLLIIGTTLPWEAIVVRPDANGQPQNHLLVKGTGPQTQPVYIRPNPGEVVYVTMYQDVIGVQQATAGFLWAGADDGFYPKGTCSDRIC